MLEEELFVIVPVDSALVPSERNSLTLHEVAALPLILPSPGHGLRRRISLEFERANVSIDPVAEIDSLPLLMHCVGEGLGATIKPMAAIHALGNTPENWRCLRIADVAMTRTNYLYALPPQMLSPCAAVVRDELKRSCRAGECRRLAGCHAGARGGRKRTETREEAALSEACVMRSRDGRAPPRRQSARPVAPRAKAQAR